MGIIIYTLVMPAKKSKKSKKSGNKKNKKKEDKYAKSDCFIPPIIDPRSVIPNVIIKVSLLEPRISMFEFSEMYPIDTRLEVIRRKIVQKHFGACGDISLYYNIEKLEEKMEFNKT